MRSSPPSVTGAAGEAGRHGLTARGSHADVQERAAAHVRMGRWRGLRHVAPCFDHPTTFGEAP